MIRILRPDFQYDSLPDIPAKELRDKGIKGFLLDLDNTISPWNDRTLTQEVINWFEELKALGLKACIISNNRHPDRVSAIANALEILYVYQAAKPRKSAFLQGLKTLDLNLSEVAVIGDQLFTDVLGGKRMGMKTILVSPIDAREFSGTKILRLMERIVGRKVVYINEK